MHFQKSCHKIRDDKGADTFRDLVGKYVCRGAAAVRCLGVAASRAAAACESPSDTSSDNLNVPGRSTKHLLPLRVR